MLTERRPRINEFLMPLQLNYTKRIVKYPKFNTTKVSIRGTVVPGLKTRKIAKEVFGEKDVNIEEFVH